MATKKKTALTTDLTVDQSYVEEAYKEAVKAQVATYFTNCVVEKPNAEKKLMEGLNIIRNARLRALELVKN